RRHALATPGFAQHTQHEIFGVSRQLYAHISRWILSSLREQLDERLRRRRSLLRGETLGIDDVHRARLHFQQQPRIPREVNLVVPHHRASPLTRLAREVVAESPQPFYYLGAMAVDHVGADLLANWRANAAVRSTHAVLVEALYLDRVTGRQHPQPGLPNA